MADASGQSDEDDEQSDEDGQMDEGNEGTADEKILILVDLWQG
jgi:hypothetical protein